MQGRRTARRPHAAMRPARAPSRRAGRSRRSPARPSAVTAVVTSEVRHAAFSCEVKARQQMIDVFARPRRRDARHRIVAVRQVDRDFLDDAAGPLAHHQDAVRHDHRFHQIMGDQQGGDRRRCDGLRKALLQDELGLRVERGERLVEQHDRRLDRQACARARRAGACRRTTDRDSCRQNRASRQRCNSRNARSRRSARLIERASSPNSTLCTIVRHGSSRSFCSMKPTLGFGPSTGTWLSRIRPSFGRSSPATRLRIVLLPQPEGPTMATNSPARTSRLTRSIAVSQRRAAGRGEPLGHADEVKHRCRVQHRRHPVTR